MAESHKLGPKGVPRRLNHSTPNIPLGNYDAKKSVFPEHPTISGYLQITKKQANKKPKWKDRFFCLKHNFLLSAPRPDSDKLERVISLDAANIEEYIIDHKHMISIATHRKTYLLRTKNKDLNDHQTWHYHLTTATSLKIEDLYELDEQLGVSATQNTTVRGGTCKTTERRVAIKIVDKRTCDHRLLANEVKILKKLEHPHVVQLYDIFETPDILYLIMERLEGGELFEQLTSRGEGFHYTEKKVCEIVRQIAHGVRYMHRMGIVHRDLKPENILCTNDSVETVKVADFGISKCLQQKDEFMRTMCGTISYTAPEVIQGKPYGKEVDYWSVGVIMYILLCGYPPFYGESDFDIATSIISRDPDMPDEEWGHVSKKGKEVVKSLLNRDPKKRLSLDQLLDHVWKNGPEVSSEVVPKHVQKKMGDTYKAYKQQLREAGKQMSTGYFEMNGKIKLHELEEMANKQPDLFNGHAPRRRNVSYGGYFVENDERNPPADPEENSDLPLPSSAPHKKNRTVG